MKRLGKDPVRRACDEPLSRSSATRRRLLTLGAGLPFVGFALATAWAQPPGKPQACVDPDDIEDGLRKSLHYAEASPDAQKVCGGCSFFSTEDGGCGHCQIMNGPANAHGHCDSWSPKK